MIENNILTAINTGYLGSAILLLAIALLVYSSRKPLVSKGKSK